MRKVTSVALLALLAAGCSHKSPGGDDDDDVTGDGGTGDDGGTGPGPRTVTLVMHHQPANPGPFGFLVAYQDGSGPWALAPAPAGETYKLPIFSPAYAVAWTCISAAPTGALRQVNMYQFAMAERTDLTVEVPPRCSQPTGTVTLHGSLANPAFLTNYVVKFGDRSAIVGDGGEFTLVTPPGTHDLIVLGGSSISSSGEFVAATALVQRGLTASANMDLDLDANDAEAVQGFAVNNLFGGARQTSVVDLYTANGTLANLVTDAGFPFSNEALAADQMAAGDIYNQQMQITQFSGASVASSTATATPGDETWIDVPPLGAVTPSSASAPYIRLTTDWTAYPSAVGYNWLAAQTPGNACGGGGNCTILWTAQLSAGVIGAAGSYTMPDLSALAGWSPALQMVAGAQVKGGVQAMTSSGIGDFPALVPPAAGTHRTFATTPFAVTP
ncbi:MAG: hypothetical protein ABI678_10025 [Kofleriaceae bacterium]